LLAAGLCLTGTAYAATTGAADQSGGVTIASAGKSQKVAYGRQLQLSGRVAAGGGRSVRLEQAPGGQGWRPVAQTTSAGDGSYRFAVRAERSGAYRAVTDGGSSPPEKVTVVARLAGKATRHVRRGSTVRVRGSVRPGRAGRTVRLQRRSGRGWKTVDRARTSAGGRFHATWHPGANGSYRLRVRFGGDSLNAAAGRTLRERVHVYRPALASWYGPGLYGGHLACGGTLTPSTLGVANKSLRCGTKVTLRYHGRSVTVPVVDRGPYVGSREFDLTAATKRKLGFGSTGTVWTTR
jgi:rare lipoprotein A (peptidoglycan hydrolase)